ncbi:MAG: tetratricopeptide repeat protein [Planctomycetes bacterium]|nr:tetratricopeptide repeat protein [Planctomycetota bacterium]
MILAILAVGCATPQAASEDGWSQLARRDYQTALSTFNQALQENETAELQAGRAKALYFLDQHIASESAYSRALALNPEQAQWHMEYALVQIACQDYADGIVSCNEAIRLQPQLAIAFHNRGFIYHVQGKLGAAEADFSKAIDLDPNFAEAYNSRGIVHAERRNFQAAIKDFQIAIRIQPEMASAHANAAASNYALGRAELAFVGLNTAIKIDRKNSLFFKNRGRIYLDLGNRTKAADDFEQALVYAPGDANLWKLLAQARESSDKKVQE